MSPALRDCLEQMGVDETRLLPDIENMLEDFLKLTLVEGVKIGGIYQHWKGKEYIVSDVVRDADDWDTFKVVYQELTDARHRAERKVSWFLGDMNDERHVGPRFRLVG